MRFAFVLALAAQWFGGGEKNTREGAEHFEAGRLEEALRAFSRAEGEFPDAPENDLNLAGVHYRMAEAAGGPAAGGGADGSPAEGGPLAEALRGYQAALQTGLEEAGAEVRRDALFNLGNALFRGGAFREAAAAYGEAIVVDPEDAEARQNLEQALRRAEEDEQQQQQQDGEDREDQEQQQNEQDQEQNEQEGQDQQREGQPPQQPGQEPESGQDQQPPPPEGTPEPAEQPPADDTDGDQPEEAGPGNDVPDSAPGEVPDISPEQAERILAALADVERAFQEQRLEQRRARALRRGRH